MTWNPLSKRSSSYLTSKPNLSQGLATHIDDRNLEIAFLNLHNMEDNSKKLYKEMKRYEESLACLQRLESKMASELCNANVCQEDQSLKNLAQLMQSVSYQMGHATDDFNALSHKTVVEPLKKLNNEFASIAAVIKKRDIALNECLRQQTKAEKVVSNAGIKSVIGASKDKSEQKLKSAQDSIHDFETQNRLLLLELPQFYEKRIDYFQPCLQALVRSQVDYYGESTRLLTNFSSSCPSLAKEEFDELISRNLGDLHALSIVD